MIKRLKAGTKKYKNILVKTPRTGIQCRELLHVIPNAKRPGAAVGADFMSVRSPERANVVRGALQQEEKNRCTLIKRIKGIKKIVKLMIRNAAASIKTPEGENKKI